VQALEPACRGSNVSTTCRTGVHFLYLSILVSSSVLGTEQALNEWQFVIFILDT
jgi:hypothetical protein